MVCSFARGDPPLGAAHEAFLAGCVSSSARSFGGLSNATGRAVPQCRWGPPLGRRHVAGRDLRYAGEPNGTVAAVAVRRPSGGPAAGGWAVADPLAGFASRHPQPGPIRGDLGRHRFGTGVAPTVPVAR